MKVPTLLFVLLLIPTAALASAMDCPKEPATNVPIVSGDVYAGIRCTLKTPGDNDSFVFGGNSGDTWQIVASHVAPANNNSVCLTLYDPNFSIVFPKTCTNPFAGQDSVVDSQTLTATGTYTVVISDTSGGVNYYAVSLERLNPFPPDAQNITLAQTVNGEIAPISDQNVFAFKGYTTGEYQLSTSHTSANPPDVCMYLYSTGGTSSVQGGCTNTTAGADTIQFDLTPTQNGTYMVLINAKGNDGTLSYNFEVSCLVGNCPPGETTTTTLTSTPNPSTSGETVIFTATVTSGSGAPPNGETISFMKGKTLLGTGMLSSGKASFTTSTLKVGTTPVTAVYGGDFEGQLDFNPSKSKPVKQVVQ